MMPSTRVWQIPCPAVIYPPPRTQTLRKPFQEGRSIARSIAAMLPSSTLRAPNSSSDSAHTLPAGHAVLATGTDYAGRILSFSASSTA